MLIKNYVKSISVMICLLILIISGRHTMQAVKNAIIICYESVIPSLYIFMVFSTYIAGNGLSDLFYLPFSWYGKLMKIQDKKYPAFLFLSIIGGFAIGANYINILQKSGYSKKRINAIAPSLINNSLSFYIFAVGIGVFKNINIGLMLFTATATASLITSFLLSFIYKYNIVTSKANSFDFNKNFVSSITVSVENILSVCGVVIMFYTLCEVISLYIDSSYFNVFLTCCTEITSGCKALSNFCGNNYYLFCLILSFLPVSTLFQVLNFTNNFAVVKTLIFSRIIHCPLSLIIFSLLVNIFPIASYTVASDSITIKAFSNTMEISACMFLITVSFLSIFDKNKLFTKVEN